MANQAYSAFIDITVEDGIQTLSQFEANKYCNIILLTLRVATIYELAKGIAEVRHYSIEYNEDRKMCIRSKKISPCISRGEKLLFPKDFEPIFDIEEVREKVRWIFDSLRFIEVKIPIEFKYPKITFSTYRVEVDRRKYWPKDSEDDGFLIEDKKNKDE